MNRLRRWSSREQRRPSVSEAPGAPETKFEVLHTADGVEWVNVGDEWYKMGDMCPLQRAKVQTAQKESHTSPISSTAPNDMR